MCTQVGVGGLVVGYAVVGAFGFSAIEGKIDRPELAYVAALRHNVTDRLWHMTSQENIFNKTAWLSKSSDILVDFQKGVAEAVKRGRYDGRKADETWTFPATLMFCLSVFTMIGYGNLVPWTPWGKALTVLYAVFGIPLYVLYFMNMGEVLAAVFKWVYTKIYQCSRRNSEREKRIVVPSTACLWVLGGYIATGTVMFAEWEKWDYLDSTYFCVTSLCKIGIGDFVPGANIRESAGGRQTKLVINFVYLLVGMGLVAMCYNLTRELLKLKMAELRRQTIYCMEHMRAKVLRSPSSSRATRSRSRSRPPVNH